MSCKPMAPCLLHVFFSGCTCPITTPISCVHAPGKLPVLGICYGAQEIVNHFGGLVERAAKREFGFAELNLANDQPGAAHLFTGVPETSRVCPPPLLIGWACLPKTNQALLSHPSPLLVS